MTEQLNIGPERKLPEIDTSAEARKNLERIKEESSKNPENNQKSIEEIRKEIEKQSVESREISIAEQQNSDSPLMLQKELKNIAFRRSLEKIQNQLPALERTFSKVIHNSKVERVSEVVSKTAARPSGILGGSLVAFIGSSAVLYISRYYGFEYNYFLFFLLFFGGFALGILFELTYRLVKRNRV